MAVLARQGSRESGTYAIANSIVSGRAFDPGDFVIGLDRFLRRVFVYREEHDEVLRDVPFMLNDYATLGRMEGDCDDMSIMASALLCCVGIPARVTAIKSQSIDEFDHVFSEARIGMDWIPVDPTVPYGTPYRAFGFMSEVVC